MNRVREKRGSVERELAGCWDHDPTWAGPVGRGTQASDFFRGRAGFVFSKPRPLALCIWVNTP